MKTKKSKTTPKPARRQLTEVQTEYQQICAKAGDTQYRIKLFQTDLDALNTRLVELNREAVLIQSEMNRETLDAAVTTKTQTKRTHTKGNGVSKEAAAAQ